MTVLVATRGAANLPVYKPSGNSLGIAHGTINIDSNPVAADTIQMCRIPKGAVITGGRLTGDKLETSTSGATLTIKIGHSINGVLTSDSMGDFGAVSAAAVTGIKPEVGYNYPLGGLLMSAGAIGPLSAEAIVTITVSASATNFSTGDLNLFVQYYVP